MTVRALLLLLLAALGALPAARCAWCARADPAWRARTAPLALVVTALPGSGRDRPLLLHRVLRRPASPRDRWARAGRVLRLRMRGVRPGECTARFEAELPLRVGERYIVFAERRGGRPRAIGPPLKDDKKMRRRISRVQREGHTPPKVKELKSVTVEEGNLARFECQATGRPPPRITWYINSKPVEQSALRRLRVLTYRRRSVLLINDTSPSDSGRVECSARGIEGPPRIVSANLTVHAANTQSFENKLLEQSSPCPVPSNTSYCMNGGTCLFFQQIAEMACKCPEGYLGHRCEIKAVQHSMYRSSFSCKLGLSISYYC